jgi:hypothetical protein
VGIGVQEPSKLNVPVQLDPLGRKRGRDTCPAKLSLTAFIAPPSQSLCSDAKDSRS